MKRAEVRGSVESRSPASSRAGVDGLEAGLVVDLLGALALEDDGGDADGTVPDGEVGDGGCGREGKAVGAFLDVLGVILEDLDDVDVGVAVVDGDVDGHLGEGEDGGVGGGFVLGGEGSGVGVGRGGLQGVKPREGEGGIGGLGGPTHVAVRLRHEWGTERFVRGWGGGGSWEAGLGDADETVVGADVEDAVADGRRRSR